MLHVLDTEDVMVCLEDVICFEKHLQGIKRLLWAIRKARVKLPGITECQFATTSVKFLGYVIYQDGVKPHPEKLEIIQKWKVKPL